MNFIHDFITHYQLLITHIKIGPLAVVMATVLASIAAATPQRDGKKGFKPRKALARGVRADSER